MTIAVDFDGTIVEHEYPAIGKERQFAIQVLKMLIDDGHRLILWSVRKGDLLDQAVAWCRERGIEFYAVNQDSPNDDPSSEDFSRKLNVDLFIDDRNVGGMPSWGDIYRMINEGKSYQDLSYEDEEYSYPQPPKRKWWPF